MTKEQLQKLFDAREQASNAVGKLHAAKDHSLDDSIAYQRAWRAFEDAAIAYYSALNGAGRAEMSDVIKKLDVAMQILTILWQETHETEIAYALDILSAYREQHIQDNGQFGVGA